MLPICTRGGYIYSSRTRAARGLEKNPWEAVATCRSRRRAPSVRFRLMQRCPIRTRAICSPRTRRLRSRAAWRSRLRWSRCLGVRERLCHRHDRVTPFHRRPFKLPNHLIRLGAEPITVSLEDGAEDVHNAQPEGRSVGIQLRHVPGFTPFDGLDRLVVRPSVGLHVGDVPPSPGALQQERFAYGSPEFV